MANYLDKSGLLRVLRGVKNQIERNVGELKATKGRPNGIASLDGKGFVPLAQLGNLDMNFFEAVQELPTKDIKKHIYLIKNTKEGKQDTYDEFIYTGDVDGEYDSTKWEKLGDFVPTFDLKEYAKKKDAVNSISIRDIVTSVDVVDDYELGLYYINGDGEEKQVTIPVVTVGGVSQLPNGVFRPYTGHNGLMTSKDKAKLDKIDTTALSQSISNANTAADNTNEAIRKCETATAGAEKCNVTLEGTKIVVTNRNGEVKETEVVDTEEVVTVAVTSSVESISVAGLKVNVFLNNGKTPQTYTTNAEGKATFTIARGNYYQVVFPEYGNAQPIAPVGYTAVLGSRSINAEYVPYNEDTSEKVVVNVQKCGNDNECAAWEGMPVTITYDGKDSVVNTDSNGQVVAFVPFGKEYTVKVEDKDGYNVSYNRNVRTFKAELPKRIVVYKLYKFRAGVFILDTNRNEYYLDEWIAAGRNADDAVAIKIADANLAINNSAFCIKTADMKNTAQLKYKTWCLQDVLFKSIKSYGDNMNDENFYRGNTLSYLVRQEAQERSLAVPAFDYAYSTTLVLGGEELRGFIMSIGQENVHVANLESIKEILTSLFSADIAASYETFIKRVNRWVSAQNGNSSAYYFYSKLEGFSMKSNENIVLPAYPC